jgi:hypothetical protein
MTPSTELFDLIKSLSKTEKGYFKKSSRLHVRGGENNYILLFDTIEKQKKYNEEKLLLKFKDRGFARQFPVAKNYLYHHILHTMDKYYRTVQSEVNSLINQSGFLYSKGLLKQSGKVLEKAKKISRQNEFHSSILEMLRSRETNLAIRQHNMARLRELMLEEEEEIKKIQAVKAHRDLYFRVIMLYNEFGKAREKSQLKQMDQLLSSYRKKKFPKSVITFECLHRMHSAHMIYWYARGNGAKAFFHTKKIIALFQRHPHILKENISAYLSHLNNAIAAGKDAGCLNEIPLLLDQLKNASGLVRTKLQRANWFYNYDSNYLYYYNYIGSLNEISSRIGLIEKELAIHENGLSPLEKVLLYHAVSLAYFSMGNFRRALGWQNRIRNDISFQTHVELECALKIFYLIVHYEAGNIDLVPQLVKSLYRFLLKKKRVYKYEAVLLDFFKKGLPKADSQKKLTNAFRSLQKKMQPLANDSFEKHAFDHFDLLNWLESKVRNKTFNEIILEKARG